MQKKIKFFFLAILPLISLFGCATVYQKEGVFTNGYSDYRVSPDTFVVTFRANEHTSPENVMQYALKRAAKLAIKNGFTHFAIIDEPTRHPKKLHYPSVRIAILCFIEKPLDRESINAHQFLGTESP